MTSGVAPSTRALRRGLIVSCQAADDSPLHAPATMALFAQAAAVGGAVAIRANGPADVRAIRRVLDLPIIGLWKRPIRGYAVYITPRASDAGAVARAGADLVAIDATLRARPGGRTAGELIRWIDAEVGAPVVADVDSVEAGRAADLAGASFVATTLSGYTGGRTERVPTGPDLELVRALADACACPVIAEGRYRTADEVAAAFAAGAYAVCVGAAITDPIELTRRLAAAAKPAAKRARPKKR